MIDVLKRRIAHVMGRVDGLSLRERALLFVGVIAVLYLVAMKLLVAPLRAEHNRVNNLRNTKHEQTQAMNQQVQALLGAAGAGENAPLAALERQLKDLDSQLDQMTGGMVTPQQMAKLLGQVLARHQGVELIKIENLPKSLAVGQTLAGGGPPGVAIYKHGVRLQVRGSYFDIVNYMKALEALPWKVYWGQAALEAEKYPLSKVTLVLYTLSRNSGWIGV